MTGDVLGQIRDRGGAMKPPMLSASYGVEELVTLRDRFMLAVLPVTIAAAIKGQITDEDAVLMAWAIAERALLARKLVPEAKP